MAPPGRVVLQPGVGDAPDLAVYAHIDPGAIKAHVAEVTNDAMVVEFWGEGTAAYKIVLPRYGGTWDSLVTGLETKLSKRFPRSCLVTWSAGSQVAKDVCMAGGGRLPDAIVMVDGLYAAKPPGSKQGDGKVIWDKQLEALAQYALRAARGDCVMVIFHSRIATPYASSKECAEAIQKRVEALLGEPMHPDTSVTVADLDNHGFAEAWAFGDLHIVEFAGNDAKEHIAQAHLYDEVWKLWVPWVGKAAEKLPPPVGPTPRPEGDPYRLIAERAVEVSLAEEAARVGEKPPGSNKVKPEYWAGTTRIIGGKEQLTKVTVGAWCAAAFQWADYEAARQLGFALVDVDDWRSGFIPHGRRISVREVQDDYTSRKLFVAASEALAGHYEPKKGDAVFLDRATASGADLGHLPRYIRRIDAATYETIGGNESSDGKDKDDGGDRWRRTVRRFDDKRLRGFGTTPPEAVHVDPEMAAMFTASEVKELDASAAKAIYDANLAWMNRPRDEHGNPIDGETVEATA